KVKVKVTYIYFARHCRVNLVNSFKMIEVNLRPGLYPQPKLVLILPTIGSLSRACLPRELNPGPRDQPADQEAVTLTIRPRCHDSGLSTHVWNFNYLFKLFHTVQKSAQKCIF